MSLFSPWADTIFHSEGTSPIYEPWYHSSPICVQEISPVREQSNRLDAKIWQHSLLMEPTQQ